MKTTTLPQTQKYIWSAPDLLGKISKHEFHLPASKLEYFRDFFWNDLCAEWDSVNLYNEIKNQHQNQNYSVEFMNFIESWYLEEQNHASGFMYILCEFFGENQDDLLFRLKQRKPDFHLLKEFIHDEFKFLVLYAYDEYMTIQTFKKDQFYNDFGSPVFKDWIQHVKSDEAKHFHQVVKILRHKYKNLFSQQGIETLKYIRNIELNLTSYNATFLFDHEDSHFLLTDSDLEESFSKVCELLTKLICNHS